MRTTYLRAHRARIAAIILAVLLPSAGLFPLQLSSGATALMWLAGVALIVFVLSDYSSNSAMHEHPHPDIHPHPEVQGQAEVGPPPGSPQENPSLAGGDHWPHHSASG